MEERTTEKSEQQREKCVYKTTITTALQSRNFSTTFGTTLRQIYASVRDGWIVRLFRRVAWDLPREKHYDDTLQKTHNAVSPLTQLWWYRKQQPCTHGTLIELIIQQLNIILCFCISKSQFFSIFRRIATSQWRVYQATRRQSIWENWPKEIFFPSERIQLFPLRLKLSLSVTFRICVLFYIK